MKSREQLEHEVAGIILAAVAGEGTQAELEKLNALILQQPELAEFVVDLMSQESWLSWYSARSRKGNIRSELLEHIAQVVQSSNANPQDSAPCLEPSAKSSGSQITQHQLRRSLAHTFVVGARYVAALAALLLVAVGVVIGMIAVKWQQPFPADVAGLPNADSDVIEPASSYEARFVQGTACLWNQEATSLNSDDALRTGESLSLLEGLAELQLDWDTGGAALRIEGPASLVLTAERGASLSHGRFTADVEASEGQFSLSTPQGLIEVAGHASLGVVISGGDVELHVFKGTAQFVGPWTRADNPAGPVAVNAGDAIRIVADLEGRIRLDRETASPSSFASKVSMGSDHLVVTPEYIREVISDKPLIYWRFEDSEANQVANEMSDSYQAHLTGVADRVRQAGNTSLELGAGLSAEALQSYVLCNEPLSDDFTDGYSVEAWVKPSHYHWGSLIAFLGNPPQPGWRAPHGFLLEIGGPCPSATAIEHPGRLRYLHRNPPSEDFNSGTSCFSEAAYELRKWQQIVAVKNQSEMRLYINGELVAQGEDSSTLAPGMKIMIGQLDREQFYRKFIGQIDELAIYPRPLSEQEIKKHFKLIRPSGNKLGFPRESNRTASFQAPRRISAG